MTYITLARCKEAMQSSYNGAQDTQLTDCLSACCDFLDKYTNRSSGGFAVQTYDELYNGSGDHILFVNNAPIVSISKVATTQLPAVLIHNTDSDMGTRATVQVNTDAASTNYSYTSTGITLTYVKNAVTTTNTFTWVAYPTVNDLVTAINGAGNNWTATVQGGFGTWATSDIRGTMGAFGARITSTYLWIHWQELPWYRVQELTGEIYSPMGFARGWGNWRIVYQAGYATFPNDLAQALAELTAATFYARNVNANTQNESLAGGYSYSQVAEKTFDGLSLVAKKTFMAYKRRPVPHWSIW